VPAAYFKAGKDFLDRPEDRKRMKASYTTVHYHQPTDQLAPWWNLDGAVSDLQILFECLQRVAERRRRADLDAGRRVRERAALTFCRRGLAHDQRRT
jgi:hypothetical protein